MCKQLQIMNFTTTTLYTACVYRIDLTRRLFYTNLWIRFNRKNTDDKVCGRQKTNYQSSAKRCFLLKVQNSNSRKAFLNRSARKQRYTNILWCDLKISNGQNLDPAQIDKELSAEALYLGLKLSKCLDIINLQN